MNNIAGLSESFATNPLPFSFGKHEVVNTPNKAETIKERLFFLQSSAKIPLFFQPTGKRWIFEEKWGFVTLRRYIINAFK